MMREIKFRAWDKKRKIMIGIDYPDNWGEENDEEWADYYYTMLTGITEASEDERLELMQFTGLHDKNGKEIYEGDVVETALGNHVVVWENYGFLYPGIVFHYNHAVIGNIHENPELLEGK